MKNWMSEVKRLARVVDMMATMHATLAQRYKHRALTVDVMLIAAATVVVALTFADLAELQPLGVEPSAANVIIGVASVTVFFLSIVVLHVDWKGVSGKHKEAFDALIRLKGKNRRLIGVLDSVSDDEVTSHMMEASLTMSQLVEIPDHHFNSLKARHLRKIEVSKMLSVHPGSSAWMLGMRVWIASNRRALAAKYNSSLETALPGSPEENLLSSSSSSDATRERE